MCRFAHRGFLLATLDSGEDQLRALMLPHEQASVLWEGGPYPEEVASLLAATWREMPIKKLATVSDFSEVSSDAFPIPMRVVPVDGRWLVDAGPLIEARLATRS